MAMSATTFMGIRWTWSRGLRGAGSYVAGEETSLLHSVMGLRGSVRPRPPYPTERGLWGRPTVVNNVETLAALPAIVADGGLTYARLGRTRRPGRWWSASMEIRQARCV